MESDKVLVCPICQFKNKSTVLECARCGISLTPGTTTVDVSDVSQEIEVATKHMTTVHRHGLLNKGIVLYVAGEIRPLIIRGKSEIILGRKSGESDTTTVDMTQFRGHLLGVSRRHARIKLSDDGYLLEDLNSTNGTWLNERRVVGSSSYVVTNGDQIRLGQLVLYIYFSSQSTRQVISLRDLSSGVLPDEEALVKPYLETLIAVQEIIDDILQQNAKPTVLETINNSTTGLVDVRLEDLMDAVQLMRDVIQPWKQENSAKISLMKAAEQQEADSAAIDPDVVQSFNFALSDLGIKMVKHTIPDLSTVDIAGKAEAFLPHLRKLAFTPLHITDGLD